MMLSDHVSYAEATKSLTALRLGIDNTPNTMQLSNMTIFCIELFEPLRSGLGGLPINFASFFRAHLLNKAIGGAHKIVDGKRVETSQHCADKGAAGDLDNDGRGGPTNKEIFDFIRNFLTFDQVINEFNFSWVHASYNKGNNRGQILEAYKENGKTKYRAI